MPRFEARFLAHRGHPHLIERPKNIEAGQLDPPVAFRPGGQIANLLDVSKLDSAKIAAGLRDGMAEQPTLDGRGQSRNAGRLEKDRRPLPPQ